MARSMPEFIRFYLLLPSMPMRPVAPRIVLKELAMHRIAYNLIRALMQRAALTYDVDLERISFKGSLDSLHHFADAIYAAHRKPRKQAQLFDAMLRVIASDLVPLRPKRSEPRARKRRPKTINYLPNLAKKCIPHHTETGRKINPKCALTSCHSRLTLRSLFEKSEVFQRNLISGPDPLGRVDRRRRPAALRKARLIDPSGRTSHLV